mgnify:CR=1 FL=1
MTILFIVFIISMITMYIAFDSLENKSKEGTDKDEPKVERFTKKRK